MKIFREIIKNKNGAYTIETAVIMTVVFLVVFFLIAVDYILYEQVRVNAIAESTAERAAIVYSVYGKDMETGAVNPKNFMERTPYWRLMDFSMNDRISKAGEFANKKLDKYDLSVDSKDSDNVKVEFQNFFIYKRVKVTVTK